MKSLALTLALLSPLAMAHNFKESAPVPLVKIGEQGELVLSGNEVGYQPWQSTQLTGKVHMIQHIAGRSSAKELNAPMIEAIKAAKLPHDQYQTVTIINSDDAIWGTSGFVKSSAEKSKQEFPWSSIVLDAKGMARNAWALTPESSAIVLLGKDGKVLFAKDGQLAQADIDKVMGLIKTHL
ncbi:YtfJ family protein [Aeromonas simiae]|uniref:YtfJ family protein n=1 Tax=Aeromonas simiae TaxID=218936 RepID=UPI00266CD813|nr:YtfJ family protein [Aeromonas simiae]MDO2949717.1 YtfJ family protein [Aeromonas simiae]MDO2953390.1 YtfJ family protein [Aeromonas simiae]MDO2957048.1 YtfJ family protein [Aeromonas simiae]